jgi:IS4 transposase
MAGFEVTLYGRFWGDHRGSGMRKNNGRWYLSNLLAFGATTIAAIYKDRWQVELFFKALKQTHR